MSELPEQALELRSLVTPDGMLELSLQDVDIPAPVADEVVVRVEASPVNPSDLGLLIPGADMSAATVTGTPERPVVTAPLPPGALAHLSVRVGQSLPVGNEGAGTGARDRVTLGDQHLEGGDHAAARGLQPPRQIARRRQLAAGRNVARFNQAAQFPVKRRGPPARRRQDGNERGPIRQIGPDFCL